MRTLLALSTALLAPCAALAANTVCPRPAAGSAVLPPPDLYSNHGVLNVTLNYRTDTDPDGRQTYCFVTPDGLESPTLHVKPGDTLNISLTNDVREKPAGLAAAAPAMPMSMSMTPDPRTRCGAGLLSGYSTNMHFHGTNTSPTCHSDEVIHTLVNPGQTFAYSVRFPTNEPPGLYWYHPHVHGLSNIAVLGGATGAIIVDGIEKLQPAVAKLPVREIVLRDQLVVNGQSGQKPPPGWDVSVNYVPVDYPTYPPSVITMAPNSTEFWRVANTSADTIMNLKIDVDGAAWPMNVAARDGIALGSQDGAHRGQLAPVTNMLLPPGGRVEFVLKAPPETTRHAQLITEYIDTGKAGDRTPQRPLADIRLSSAEVPHLPVMPAANGSLGRPRFDGLADAKPTAFRNLYFSEIAGVPRQAPNGRWGTGIFFITVNGQTPQPFNPDAPPAITTTQGAVEDWTIENRSLEPHEFHIHQLHFQLRAENHLPLARPDQVFLDTVQVPAWDGKGAYPSVTVRMDFRGDLVGDFVYHCHILGHEDRGMMAIIRVNPRN